MPTINDIRHLENVTVVPASTTAGSAFGMSDDDSWWRWFVAVELLRWGPAACLVMVSVGVPLSVVIWTKLHRHLPTTVLYLLIAILVELLPVYMHCGSYALKQITGDEKNELETSRHNSPSLCRVLPFIDSVTLHLSTWLAAVTAAQTAIHRVRPPAPPSPSPGQPHRRRRFDGARSVVLLLVVLIVCLDAHCFWSYSLVEMDSSPPGQLICSTMKQNELFRDIIRPAVDLLVVNVAPFITLILSLLSMACTKAHPNVERNGKSQSSDLHGQFLTTVVVISCYHLLLTTPKLVADLLMSLSPAPETQQLSSLSVPAVISTDRQLVVFLCRFLFHVYVAGKLFIFFAACSAFRRRFLSLITCSCCR